MVGSWVLDERDCNFLLQNEKYLVRIGVSVSVYKKDLSQVCVFKRKIYPAEAWFLNNETLLVVTTTKELVLLSIEKKELLCFFKPIKGNRYGDEGRFAPSKDKKVIYGVVPSWSGTSGYVATIDPHGEWCNITQLPKDFKSMRALVNVCSDYEDNAVTFFHHGSAEAGMVFHRIWRGYPPFSEPFECVWSENLHLGSPDLVHYKRHNETYVFGYSGGITTGRPGVAVCTNWHTQEKYTFPLPSYFNDHPIMGVNLMHNNKYLVVNNYSILIVIDFATGKHVAQYTGEYLSCCEIIGDKIFVGTWKKTMVYPFPAWMEWEEKPKLPEPMLNWQSV